MEKISIKAINHFFTTHGLTSRKILVGVSGGMDSMVLLHLLHQLPLSIAAAHCNFTLRDSESDGDEALVESYCKERGIQFFSKRFDTSQYAAANSISIEMAARDLRYAWFEELTTEFGFDYIAIAHNLNDSIETFFLNLTRGSGIKGLTGINPVNGKVIRPLIDVSRDQIANYAEKHKIAWRTDATNLTNIYRRNFIRHNILPQLLELNPSFIATMQQNLAILSGAYEIIESQAKEATTTLLTKQGSAHYISISGLTIKPGWETLLFEMLNGFGFSSGEFEMAKGLVLAQTGSRVVSGSHILWKSRGNLVIEPNLDTAPFQATIESPTGQLITPIKLSWAPTQLTGKEPCWQPNQAVFEVEKLTFPLILRNWQPGDSFVPSGMTGVKKVSDFLTDQKIESHTRASILVMESGGKIAWVVGFRVSELFRKKGTTGMAIIFNME